MDKRYKRYIARIGGNGWMHGPTVETATIREARRWAEKYGDTAGWCEIYTRSGKLIAMHYHLDPNGKWSRHLEFAE